MRNKPKSWNTFALTPSFFLGSSHPLFSLPFPPSDARGGGIGAAVGSAQIVSAIPSSLLSFNASAWGSSHGTQSFTNLYTVGPPHRLQFFMSSFSMGAFQRVWGNLCSSTWSTSFPSFTDPGVYRAVSLTPFPFSPSSPPKKLYLRGATIITDGLGHGKYWVHPAAGWD